MATFRATKAYRFSPDGTDEKTWAKFDKVPDSDPPVFEAEVTKPKDVAALRKLISDKVTGFTDITEVEEPAPVKKLTTAEKAAVAKATAEKAAAEKEAAEAAAEKAAGASGSDDQGAENSGALGDGGTGDDGDPAATAGVGGDQNGA